MEDDACCCHETREMFGRDRPMLFIYPDWVFLHANYSRDLLIFIILLFTHFLRWQGDFLLFCFHIRIEFKYTLGDLIRVMSLIIGNCMIICYFVIFAIVL